MTYENLDPRFTEVQLGIEVEAFLNSPVGRYLASRADEEQAIALDGLAVADPDDTKKIRKLQNQHWRACSIIEWLIEVIENGAHVEAEMTAE